MSIAVPRARYRHRRARPLPIAGAYAATAALLAVGGFGLGHALTPGPAPSDPIEIVGGIPVSTSDSPSGALAAADNAVAIAYGSVERDPARDERLIDISYAPAVRSSALSGAAAVRAQNRSSARFWAHGGENVSLIGARRLDSFDGATAQVSTWSADVFWGPGRPPKQAWFLTQTQLRWSGRQWLVTGTTTLPTPGPVPAVTPQSTASNSTSADFDRELNGFIAPSYGGG